MKKERNHYHLYIDDHGSRKPDHVPDLVRDDDMDCFALGGILIHELNINQAVVAYKSFCGEWKINYPLHSSEIRGMRENFRWLQDNTKLANKFHHELNLLLTNIPTLGFAAVVNRPGYNERYKEQFGEQRWQLCKTAYCILVERVAKYVASQGGTFEVFFEQSGKKEDRMIKNYARTLKKQGLPFTKETSSKYMPFTHADFKRIMLGEPRERTKKCVLTQLSDLYLYPIVKRKYDPTYRPWIELDGAGKIIDSILNEKERALLGVKYSCFDAMQSGSKKPEASSGKLPPRSAEPRA